MQGIAKSAVEIIRARPEDFPRLRPISALWLQHCEENGMMLCGDEKSVDAWMFLLTAMGPGLVFFAQSPAKEIVGACFWHFLPPPFDPTVVNGMGTFVVESWRRRGISRRLRSVASAEAIEQGATAIIGTLYSTDKAARESAFESGFVPAGTFIKRSLG